MSTALLKRCAGAGALLATAALAVPGIAGATTTTVASKIDNPRGLALAPDGTLYVASAGHAGKKCMGTGDNQQCFGKTSKVIAIKNGVKSTVAKRLLSIGGADGSFAVGVDGVSVSPSGKVQYIETSGTRKDAAAAPRWAQRQEGRLFEAGSGAGTRLAHVSRFEWAHNVDRVKGDRNSDPYAVLALDGHTLVADAGANAILDVRGSKVSLFAVIPKTGKAQSVPTSLAAGPDGSIYVGTLALEAGNGKASVYKISPTGGAPAVAATGFTAISGLAFGPDGTMYVTELSLNIAKQAPGAVVAVAPDGTRKVISDQGLLFPAGAAADANGVFVSAASVLPATTPKKSPFKGLGGSVVYITK